MFLEAIVFNDLAASATDATSAYIVTASVISATVNDTYQQQLAPKLQRQDLGRAVIVSRGRRSREAHKQTCPELVRASARGGRRAFAQI